MLLHLLHQWTDLSILAVTVIVVTGLAMLAPQVGRHVLRIPADKERDDAAFDGYKALMSMTGVVLAFSLVQANNNLHSVEATVGKEAAAISTVDRVLSRIGKPELAALRPLVAAFGASVVNDEWPLLSDGERSAATDGFYSDLSRQIRAIGPDDAKQTSMYNELLKNLDDLSDLREEVLADSDYGLPKFFWITTCGLLIVGLVLASLTESSLTRTVGVGAPAAGVALLLAFVIIVDLPFEGETSVSPSPIQKALLINSHRS
jgi:hypothetical protein